ncbi:BspA family leucine-rich repeat surface protein [Lactiplantibacillus dongliensis]|uniref:BspA family leucine-rich repeat surface protein n=1 Tax=Lactiplantibacillus dongliensis TaxID=2559919 RepID=A0ABW1R2A4_9LACO|nr:BspA family leucine-rich repeat surface protein [Lactiplantibacillus dongliensis]
MATSSATEVESETSEAVKSQSISGSSYAEPSQASAAPVRESVTVSNAGSQVSGAPSEVAKAITSANTVLAQPAAPGDEDADGVMRPLASLARAPKMARSLVADENVIVGNGVIGEVNWTINETGLLKLGGGQLRLPGQNIYTYSNQISRFGSLSKITKIVLTAPIIVSGTVETLFANKPNLTEITGLEYFDTQSITNMSGMFRGDSQLTNLDLSHFKTSNVSNMESMFENVSSLTSLNLSNFETGNVSNMESMFENASSLISLDLSSFITGNVKNMAEMFSGDEQLANLNISQFDTSLVGDMKSMFENASSLTVLDLSHFKTENVCNMSDMFSGDASLTKLDLGNFKTSLVEDMSGMFYGMTNLSELDISNFDTSNVKNMDSMFSNSLALTKLDLFNFDTSKVSNMRYMFNEMSALTELNVSSFNTKLVTNMDHMFCWNQSITKLDVSRFDTANVKNMINMFAWMSKVTTLDVTSFDTSNVENMSGMFSGMNSLNKLDVSNFDTTKVKSMSSMFSTDSSLTELDVSNFKTSAVSTMWAMFQGLSSIKVLDVSNFDTGNVETMSRMFQGVSQVQTLDVSGFTTDKVKSMEKMFEDVSSVTELNLSGWNTTQVGLPLENHAVASMESMFQNMTSLEKLDVSNFDTSNVTDMSYMFSGLSKLSELDVSSFETSAVTNMDFMFNEMSALRSLDISKFSDIGIEKNRSHNWLDKLSHLRVLKLEPRLSHSSIFNSVLVDPSDPGHWQRVGTGTIDQPAGASYSSVALRAQYAPEMADMYVWVRRQLGRVVTTKTVTRQVDYLDQGTDTLLDRVTHQVTYAKFALIDTFTNKIVGYDLNYDMVADISDPQKAWVLTSQSASLPTIDSPDFSNLGYQEPSQAQVAAQTIDSDYATTDLNLPLIRIYYQHVTDPNTDYRSVNRIMTYVDAETQGTVAPAVVQRVTYYRTAVIDRITGDLLGYDTTGDGQADTTDAAADWVLSSQTNQLASVTSPILSQHGYTAPSQAEVASVTVLAADADAPDLAIVISYGHRLKATTIDRSVTRTIQYIDGTTQAKVAPTVNQRVTYRQVQLTDLVTKKVGYDTNGDGQIDTLDPKRAWLVVGSSELAAVVSPELSSRNYAAASLAQVETLVIPVNYTGLTAITVTVTYQPVSPEVPEEPAVPEVPEASEKPVQPAVPEQPSDPVKPEQSVPVDVDTGEFTSKEPTKEPVLTNGDSDEAQGHLSRGQQLARLQANQSASIFAQQTIANTELPRTDNKASSHLALAGWGLLSWLGLAGFWSRRRH